SGAAPRDHLDRELEREHRPSAGGLRPCHRRFGREPDPCPQPPVGRCDTERGGSCHHATDSGSWAPARDRAARPRRRRAGGVHELQGAETLAVSAPRAERSPVLRPAFTLGLTLALGLALGLAGCSGSKPGVGLSPPAAAPPAAAPRAPIDDRAGPDALLALADSAVAAAEPDLARRALERAVQAAPQSAAVHLGYGRYYTAILRYKDAKAELDRAAELEPASPEPAYWLG